VHEKSSIKLTMVQLPGLNTPQFESVRTTLRRQPRPVAPVFQPEVAADAILHAADHPRRELWVGGNTVGIIMANGLAPWLGDLFLGRTNVDAQQADQPIDPGRPDYLYEPLPGDRGAHGIFDDEAKTRSLQMTLNRRRRGLTLAAGLAAGAGGGLLARARRRRASAFSSWRR
jgi:hypothetical protein